MEQLKGKSDRPQRKKARTDNSTLFDRYIFSIKFASKKEKFRN
jgi:hypothetical protein